MNPYRISAEETPLFHAETAHDEIGRTTVIASIHEKIFGCMSA